MLRNAAKRMMKLTLYKSGFEVKRAVQASFFDLTQNEGHPVEAVYASRGRPCLVKVPLSRIVTFGYGAFSLKENGGHPFVKTLQEYALNARMNAEESPLGQFYSLFQPASASEYMGLSSPSYARFKELPALSAPPLWEWDSPEDHCERIKEIYRREDVQEGAKTGYFIGGSQFGPVETRKLVIEYNRLTRIYDSIRRQGFRADRCDWMTGVALVNGDDWTIALSTGQHRIACLAALGYKNATIMLLPKKAPGGLVLRSCCRYFPTVVNGFHTEAEAAALFDRLMAGKQPSAARSWLDFCAGENWFHKAASYSRAGNPW